MQNKAKVDYCLQQSNGVKKIHERRECIKIFCQLNLRAAVADFGAKAGEGRKSNKIGFILIYTARQIPHIFCCKKYPGEVYWNGEAN